MCLRLSRIPIRYFAKTLQQRRLVGTYRSWCLVIIALLFSTTQHKTSTDQSITAAAHNLPVVDVFATRTTNKNNSDEFSCSAWEKETIGELRLLRQEAAYCKGIVGAMITIKFIIDIIITTTSTSTTTTTTTTITTS
jgi:hypothetical protein